MTSLAFFRTGLILMTAISNLFQPNNIDLAFVTVLKIYVGIFTSLLPAILLLALECLNLNSQRNFPYYVKQIQTWRLFIFQGTYPLVALERDSGKTGVIILKNQIKSAEETIKKRGTESQLKYIIDFLLLTILMVLTFLFNFLYTFQVKFSKLCELLS